MMTSLLLLVVMTLTSLLLTAGFKQLSIDDQIARVQECMYPIVMTVLAAKYDVDTNSYCYFNYSAAEEEQIMKLFPWFKDLIATFHIIGFPVQSLELDNTELSFLCALKLITGSQYQYQQYS